ncbi:MAG: NUDIX hydrolase [Chryseolinea sp.]
MDRNILIGLLKAYKTEDASDASFTTAFIDLLRHPNAFLRSHLPGHITGSAWIVDQSGQFVLLTHHAKLNKWLQPGGHADGDENVLHVAFREASEETGIVSFKLVQDGIFDLDIHAIPARADFPEHLHYDVRFLLKADMQSTLLITEESHALSWVPIAKLAALTEHNESVLRMGRKAGQLF